MKETEERARRGRPALDPSRPGESPQITLRLSPDGLRQIRAAAAASGQSTAGWCRETLSAAAQALAGAGAA